MTFRPKLIAFWFVALVCLAMTVFTVIDHFLRVPITPDTQSAFFKSYSPNSVVEPFECKESNGWGQSADSSSGRVFATHKEGFQGDFVILPKTWMPLMTSLRDDLSRQVTAHGAQILDSTGDPRGGFRVDYRAGKTFGSAVIAPLKININQSQLAQGELRVALDISIDEKWYRKEPGMITLSVDTRFH